MINSTESFKNMMLSPSYRIFIKIEIYDSAMRYIKEITQQVKSDIGTLAVNSDSPIRRSFKISLDNSLGEFTFGENNFLWLDKRLKLYVGLSTWNGTVEWIPQGIFILTDPEDNHLMEGKTATINAVDKACLMTNNRGKFVNEFIITKDADIVSTIKTIAGKVGETLFNFDTPDVADSKVKYELTYSGSDNYWSAIEELATMAKCEIYYDASGYLTLRKINLTDFDNAPIVWSYVFGSANEKLYAGNTRVMNTSELFNDVIVLGGGSQSESVKYRITVDETNPIWAGHPYSVQKIGWNTLLWNSGSPDVALETEEQCKFRAKLELMKHLGFVEDVSVNSAPNYLLDVNDIIWIEDLENGLTGDKYMIKSMNIPLSPSQMTLEVSKYKKVISDWNFI
jgi:hypothetical protein